VAVVGPRLSLRRRAYFALLYFSEGAPIGYLWWALPTRLRAAGMPVDEVAGLTALLALPWALKFLWAPAVDRLRGPRWGYRAWITVAQLAMGLTLLPLALFPLEELLGWAMVVLLAHAFAAATQDVAIDALAVASVPADDRGRVSGWMQAGMLVGRGLFGGLALAAEAWIGARAVVLVLLASVWATLAVVWLVPLPGAAAVDRPAQAPPLMRTLREVLQRRSTWAALGIALLAGAGFEAAGGLMGPYLLDRSIAQEAVGWFFALPVVVGMILGSLLGGWAADRGGHRALVGGSVLAVGASVALLAVGDAGLGLRGAALMGAALPLYLALGCLTASSYALFMDLADPRIGGTQFSAYMGATNLCEVWAVALGGRLAADLGYPSAFLALAGASMLALPLLPAARPSRRRGA